MTHKQDFSHRNVDIQTRDSLNQVIKTWKRNVFELVNMLVMCEMY